MTFKYIQSRSFFLFSVRWRRGSGFRVGLSSNLRSICRGGWFRVYTGEWPDVNIAISCLSTIHSFQNAL